MTSSDPVRGSVTRHTVMAWLLSVVVTSLLATGACGGDSDWKDANKVLCWHSQRSEHSVYDYWIQVSPTALTGAMDTVLSRASALRKS